MTACLQLLKMRRLRETNHRSRFRRVIISIDLSIRFFLNFCTFTACNISRLATSRFCPMISSLWSMDSICSSYWMIICFLSFLLSDILDACTQFLKPHWTKSKRWRRQWFKYFLMRARSCVSVLARFRHFLSVFTNIPLL